VFSSLGKVSPWYALVLLVVPMLFLFGCQEQHSDSALPSPQAWRFVVFGDTRGDFDPAKHPPYDIATATGVSPQLPRIAAKIASLHPDFVLHVGDLIGGDMYKDAAELGVFPGVVAIPYAEQFQAFKNAIRPITAAHIPFYPVRGNHEVSNTHGVDGDPDPALAAAYQQAFAQYLPHNCPSQPGLTYAFTHKQVTVVAVDQYANYLPPAPAPDPWYAPHNVGWGANFWGYHTIDLGWIRDQLHEARTPFKIVMAHEPIFVATGAADSALAYQWSPELYFGPANFNGEAARQQFVDMLGANGVQLYAVGHVHNLTIGSFQDSAGHTLYQLTAGNGGALPMDTAPDPPTPEAALHDVQAEQHKLGFTLVTVDPRANTLLLEYYVTSVDGADWSKEGFTTTIAGGPR
jgi:hypothetical protein